MNDYCVPVIDQVMGLRINLFAQTGQVSSGLTGLDQCSIVDGCSGQQTGSATFNLLVCASGISDPSELNGTDYTINYSNCDTGRLALSNCVATSDITCSQGSTAISCDYTSSCELVITKCVFDSQGITDASFVACPESAQ